MSFVKSAVLTAAVLLFSGTAVLGAAEPRLFSVDYAEPGSVVQVMISGEELENVILSLQDVRDRTQSRSEAFRWFDNQDDSMNIALLGIPSTLIPGRYRLVAKASQGRAGIHLEKIIMITEKDYPEEFISMSEDMNSLFADDSEEKKAEARLFWALLQEFDPAAVYHTGSYVLPVSEGVPTAGFGDRRRFRMPDGAEAASVHFGRDLWAESGSRIIASGRGRVVMARERIMTGNTVIIEHLPGVYSLYYHMAGIVVGEGEMVESGDTIGTIGSTGFATGVHLHWEMRVGAVPVDPEPFLTLPLLDTSAIMSMMDSTY